MNESFNELLTEFQRAKKNSKRADESFEV